MRSPSGITAKLRPGGGLMRQLGKIGIVDERQIQNVGAALDDLATIDSLAAVLTQGIDTVTSKDGRIDTKDLAAFVIRWMKDNQK